MPAVAAGRNGGRAVTAVFDPARLAAEIEVHLHQLGVATLAGAGLSVVAAAAELLRALGVEPVDQHRPIRYRVRHVLVRREALAGDELEAENLAHALRMLPSGPDHREVLIEAVA